MRVLVFGSKGWIASQFIPLLHEGNHEVILTDTRADDTEGIVKALDEHKPSHVVSLIGRTHGGGIQTIDYLELPGKVEDNVRDNLFSPLVLAILCQEKNVHFTYLGTGCIFNFPEPDLSSYTEEDKPDFFGSSYSIVKGFTDRMMHLFKHNVLNVRIRMPINNTNNPRNFITKITAYDKICSIPNSMTVLPCLLPYMVKLMEMSHSGTINLTNPGTISHNEILHLYKKHVDATFTWKNFSIEEQNQILLSKRSNNQLNTSKLTSIFPDVPNIKQATEECLLNWKNKLAGHHCALITGGCGAIGSEVVNYLKNRYNGTRFINLDALTYCGDKENIDFPQENYEFVHGDIADRDLVLKTLERTSTTMILHLAAETHVDQSFGNSFKFTETNVVGTHKFLETIRVYGKVKLVLHMSTDEVYGPVDADVACNEQSMFHPSNPYAASKAAAEMVCQSYLKSFNLPIIIMRCNNAVSKYQHEEKLIPRCVVSIKNNEKIPIHGKGESKRTFIHAQDIARAINVIAEKGKIGEIYNIGTTMEYSVMDVVNIVLGIMKPTSYDINDYVNYVPDRCFQDIRYGLDTGKLQKLGWKPRISFEDAIKEVVSYIYNRK